MPQNSIKQYLIDNQAQLIKGAKIIARQLVTAHVAEVADQATEGLVGDDDVERAGESNSLQQFVRNINLTQIAVTASVAAAGATPAALIAGRFMRRALPQITVGDVADAHATVREKGVGGALNQMSQNMNDRVADAMNAQKEAQNRGALRKAQQQKRREGAGGDAPQRRGSRNSGNQGAGQNGQEGEEGEQGGAEGENAESGEGGGEDGAEQGDAGEEAPEEGDDEEGNDEDADEDDNNEEEPEDSEDQDGQDDGEDDDQPEEPEQPKQEEANPEGEETPEDGGEEASEEKPEGEDGEEGEDDQEEGDAEGEGKPEQEEPESGEEGEDGEKPEAGEGAKDAGGEAAEAGEAAEGAEAAGMGAEAAGGAGAMAGAAEGAEAGAALGPEGAAVGAAAGAAGLDVGSLAGGAGGGGMPGGGGKPGGGAGGGDEAANAAELGKQKKAAKKGKKGKGGAKKGGAEDLQGQIESELSQEPGSRGFLWDTYVSVWEDFTFSSLLYINVHFLGFYFMPDIPFLGMLESFGLPVKLKFDEPDILQKLIGLFIFFLEFLIGLCVLIQFLAVALAIYGIVSLATGDYEALKASVSFFAEMGGSAGKAIFDIIKNAM